MSYNDLSVNKKSAEISKNFYMDLDTDRRIPSGAKLFAFKIKALSKKNGFCWASNKSLADMAKTSFSTVRRWIRKLKECGYIKTEIVLKDNTKEVMGRKIFLGGEVNEKLAKNGLEVTSETPTNKGLKMDIPLSIFGHQITNTNIELSTNSSDSNNNKPIVKKENNSVIKENNNRMLNKTEIYDRYVENLKSKYQVQSDQSDQSDQSPKHVDQPIQPLKEEKSGIDKSKQTEKNSTLNCNIKTEKSKVANDSSKYEETFTNSEGAPRVKSKLKKEKNYPKYSERSADYSAMNYGRESYDDIIERTLTEKEEQGVFKHYLAYLVSKWGFVSNPWLESFLSYHLSLSYSFKQRIENIKHSLRCNYRTIYPAPDIPKENTGPKTQYACVNIFG